MPERTEIMIRIVQLGKKVFNYEGPPGSTVGEALKTAGVHMDHLRTDLRLNGEAATAGTILHDGDIITVIPPIKGGYA